MDHSNKDATGSDSSNDGFDLASPSFYQLDRPAMSIPPMETQDGPAVSASPIPPLPASPEQQPMDLSVGVGQPARTPARPQTRSTVGQNGQNGAVPVHASASCMLLQDNVRSRLNQRYCSVANSRPDTIVAPPPMGDAGRFATPAPPPARQTGSGLGAIRHRRHSTVGTSTAAGGQLRRSGRTRRETVLPQLDDMAAVEWEASPRPVRRAAANQQAKAASDDASIARKQRQADES